MDMQKAMQARHSVRQYTATKIEDDKRARLNAMLDDINAQSGLNFQIIYDEPNCFDSMMAHYGKFDGVQNYIALVGPKSPRLDELVGYWGEHLVLLAQAMGLNTCWVALTHGKSRARIAPGENQVCLISIGYGQTQGVPHKSKPIEKLSNCTANSPDWFRAGVEAAMLAPTAVNQQKFFIKLLPDDTVSITAGRGFYSKVDLGIVKYYFELGSGKHIF